MKTPIKIVATVLAAAVATSSMSAPASAWFWKHKVHYMKKKKITHTPKSSSTGKLVVGCIMGSAVGLILASSAKGGGMKWMTQKEFETTKRDTRNDLTNDEAATIAFTCGLGAFPVMASWRQTQPQQVVVRAGG